MSIAERQSGNLVANVVHYKALCSQEVVPGFTPGVLLWGPLEAPAVAITEDDQLRLVFNALIGKRFESMGNYSIIFDATI